MSAHRRAISLVLLLAAAPAAALESAHPPHATLDDAADVPVPLEIAGAPWEDLVAPAHRPMPEDATGIGPGSRILIDMPGRSTWCTANFVWRDQHDRLHLGTAGHCLMPAGTHASHGINADYDSSLTSVAVCVLHCSPGNLTTGGQPPVLFPLGNVTYARQTGLNGNVGNDFGLVEIPATLHPHLRPAMPVWQGPTRVAMLAQGDLACHYGHGTALGAAWPTQGRLGVGISSFGGSIGIWRAALAITPGDSGSALATCIRDADGLHGDAAIGLITHVHNTSAAGTTVQKAQAMALEAGLQIVPVLVAA